MCAWTEGDSTESEEYDFGKWVAERDIKIGAQHEYLVFPEYWDTTATGAYKEGYNATWDEAFRAIMTLFGLWGTWK